MTSWDTYEDLRHVLSLFSEASGCSYVLVVIQAGNVRGEEQRFVAKSAGEFTGPGAVCAADEALSEVMDGAYAHFDIDEDEDDGPLA